MRLTTRDITPFGVRIDAALGEDVRDLPVPQLRDLVRSRLLVLLRGFTIPDGPEQIVAWTDQWGTPLGGPGTLFDDETHTADGRVPLHWDGLWLAGIPEFQIVLCPRAGTRGRTAFTDTARVVTSFGLDELRRWRSVSVTYRLRESHRVASVPVVADHPFHTGQILRFHEPAPGGGTLPEWPDQQFAGIRDGEVAAFLEEARQVLRRPEVHYVHTWKSGDVLLADNYTLLHGRDTAAPGRRLCRVPILGDPVLVNVPPAREPAANQ